METLILASASPRRRELLTRIGLSFEAVPTEVDEWTDLPAGEAVTELSRRKAEAARTSYPGRWILAADTLVSLNGVSLGKPHSPQEAKDMLRCLSGRTHQVFTGITLVRPDGKTFTARDESHVTFSPLSEAEIEAYVATGEPMDKAGAYAIQGMAGRWIQRMEGSPSGVIGLPLYAVDALLKESGYYHE